MSSIYAVFIILVRSVALSKCQAFNILKACCHGNYGMMAIVLWRSGVWVIMFTRIVGRLRRALAAYFMVKGSPFLIAALWMACANFEGNQG